MPDYLPGNVWPFVINGPLWLTMVYLIVYGDKITNTMRLIPGFSALAIAMLTLPFLCDIGDAGGFWSATACMIPIGIASGMVQGTCYSMAAAFPPEYMAAVMFGNGIAGFGSNLLRAATILIWPQDEDDRNEFRGALALYGIGFITLILCAVAQFFLRKNAYAVYYLDKTTAVSDLTEEERRALKGDVNQTESQGT